MNPSAARSALLHLKALRGYANLRQCLSRWRGILCRDRVVRHALCNVIEPIFDAHFIPHSYANRVGKGTHSAIDHLQALSRR